MVTWGTNPGMVTQRDRPRSRPCIVPRSRRSESRRKRARIHGPQARHAASRTFPSTASSSAPAPIRASTICAPPRTWSPESTSRNRIKQALVVPGSRVVKAAGRKGRPRQNFPRRRFRMARRGLQHVHRHERRRAAAAASAPPAPPIAISKAARAKAAARIWSAR